jgi:monoamine oxidase
MSYEKKISSAEKSNHFDTIIIGGGISGITAGLTLRGSRKYRESFIILEGSNEIGGRAKSVNINTDETHFPVDLGPAWFHRQKGDTLATVCERTMRLSGNYKEFMKDNESVKIFIDGKKFSKKLFYKIEKKMGRIVYDQSIPPGKSVAELLAPQIEKEIAKYLPRFGTGIRDILRKIAEAEFGGVDAGLEIEKLERFDYARIMDRTDGEMPAYSIGNICRDFAKPLLDKKLVKFNHIVESIFYENERVVVNTNQGTYTCNQLINTASIAALKKIKFDETTLPSHHKQAIDGLDMGNLEKAFLFFEDKFLNKHDYKRITHLHVYNSSEPEPKFYLLVPQKNYAMMLIGGSKAKEFTSWSEDKKLNYVVSGINEAFKTSFNIDYFRPRSKFTNWANDQFHGGSYSVLSTDSPLIQDGHLLFDPREKLNEPIMATRNGAKVPIIAIAGEANLTKELHRYYEIDFPDDVELTLSTHFSGAFAAGRKAAVDIINQKNKAINVLR